MYVTPVRNEVVDVDEYGVVVVVVVVVEVKVKTVVAAVVEVYIYNEMLINQKLKYLNKSVYFQEKQFLMFSLQMILKNISKN